MKKVVYEGELNPCPCRVISTLRPGKPYRLQHLLNFSHIYTLVGKGPYDSLCEDDFMRIKTKISRIKALAIDNP